MPNYSEELYQEMLLEEEMQHTNDNVAEELLEDLFTF